MSESDNHGKPDHKRWLCNICYRAGLAGDDAFQARLQSAEQEVTDMQTIRDHLERGTMPHTGRQWWGGMEFAISRVLGIEREERA